MKRDIKITSYVCVVLLAFSIVAPLSAHVVEFVAPVAVVKQQTKKMSYSQQVKKVLVRAKNAVLSVNKKAMVSVAATAASAVLLYAVSRDKKVAEEPDLDGNDGAFEFNLERDVVAADEVVVGVEGMAKLICAMQREVSHEAAGNFVKMHLDRADIPSPFEVDWLARRNGGSFSIGNPGYKQWRGCLTVARSRLTSGEKHDPKTPSDKMAHALLAGYLNEWGLLVNNKEYSASAMYIRLNKEMPLLFEGDGGESHRKGVVRKFTAAARDQQAHIIQMRKDWHRDYDELLMRAQQEHNDVRASFFTYHLGLVDELAEKYNGALGNAGAALEG